MIKVSLFISALKNKGALPSPRGARASGGHVGSRRATPVGFRIWSGEQRSDAMAGGGRVGYLADSTERGGAGAPWVAVPLLPSVLEVTLVSCRGFVCVMRRDPLARPGAWPLDSRLTWLIV